MTSPLNGQKIKSVSCISWMKLIEPNLIMQSIYWKFKWNFWSLTPLKDTWGHSRSPTFFANNLRSKGGRNVGLIPMHLSRNDASIDIQYDLLGSHVTLIFDLRSNLTLTFQDHNIRFDAPWRDKHDTAKSLFYLWNQRRYRRFFFLQVDLWTSGEINFGLS